MAIVRNTHQSWCISPQSQEASRRSLLLPVTNVLSLSPLAIPTLYSRGTSCGQCSEEWSLSLEKSLKELQELSHGFFFGLLCLDLAQFHKHMTKIPVQPLQKKNVSPCVWEKWGRKQFCWCVWPCDCAWLSKIKNSTRWWKPFSWILLIQSILLCTLILIPRGSFCPVN